MSNFPTKFLAIIAVLLAPLLVPAQAETVLKIATIAPDGTHWMNTMRAGSEEIRSRSDGRVLIKFYGGGVMGNEKKVLRKMRARQLHGGAFTATGLAERYPNINLYGLPLLFRSLDEVDHVRAKLDQRLIKGLADEGLISFGIAGGGFARLMSLSPVKELDDLKGRKVWVPEGDRISYSAMEALGLAPVTLPLTDVLTGLQTGLIEIIGSPPVGALALQWHTKVRYVTDLPVAYTLATLVIDRDVFERLAPGDQAIVREVMTRTYRELDQFNRAENENAAAALTASGLQYVPADATQVPAWRQQVRVANRSLGADGAFSIALLDEVETLLTDFRAGIAASAESPAGE